MMLRGIPTEGHLARAYFELAQRGAACEGKRHPWPYRPGDDAELFCLAVDMSRYDPRLFSILVRFLSERWRMLNPVAIRSQYGKMRTPAAIAVMAEFLLRSKTADDEERYFLDYLQRGLHAAPMQFYFHHLYAPGGNMARRAAEEPLAEFKRWGFLAREAPVLDDAARRPIGRRDAAARRNLLQRIFEGRGEVRLAEYLDALGQGISRQQALLDLRSMKGVRRVGKGRGARWRRAA